jgi:hypothetical protein
MQIGRHTRYALKFSGKCPGILNSTLGKDYKIIIIIIIIIIIT